MKWDRIKELLIKEFAVRAIGVCYPTIKILDKLLQENTSDIRFFKVETKSHHARLIFDNSKQGKFILAREKGFFKDWTYLEEKDVPKCLVQDIFEFSCPDEKRARLVNQMLTLKVFW